MTDREKTEPTLEEIQTILNKRVKAKTIEGLYEVTDMALNKLLGDLVRSMPGTDENVALIMALGSLKAVIDKAHENMCASVQSQTIFGNVYGRVAAFAEVDAGVALRALEREKKAKGS